MSVEEEKRELPMDIVWETPEIPPKSEDYIFFDKKRMVRPYYFEFIAHVKRRWAGKKVVDVFAHEFRQRPYEYYVEAVKSGRIYVDGKMVSTGYVVQDGQKLSHFVHRHEPPVMVEPIMILEEGRDVVTVCKPSSVPVHPCGQYRKNTVVGILQAEHGIAPLFPIHRLDRLVSGLLILARNASTADRFRQEIEAGKVQKEYVAKVTGQFPAEEVEVNANVNYDAREGKSTTEVVDGSEEQPTKGKSACTRFIRLGTDGFYSVVKCVPLSGRTHQIRVHLQHLGHPIANDALYLHTNPPSRSTKETSADRAARLGSQLRENVGDVSTATIKKQKVEGKSIVGLGPYQCENTDLFADFQEMGRDTNDWLNIHHAVSSSCTPHSAKFGLDFSVDPMCTNCPNVAPSGFHRLKALLKMRVLWSGTAVDYVAIHRKHASETVKTNANVVITTMIDWQRMRILESNWVTYDGNPHPLTSECLRTMGQ